MTPPEPRLPIRDRQTVLRIIDANQNRAIEGLRVVEEYARFAQNSSDVASLYKQLRHELVGTIAQHIATGDLVSARDTAGDVGTRIEAAAEYQRADVLDVVAANLKRIEQSLRAIEEYGKVVSPVLAKAVEQLRYRAYDAAKTFQRLLGRTQQLANARLYVLMDGGPSLDTFVRTAEQLVDHQVDILQLRDKTLSDRELLARARALRAVTRDRTLFVMNDRADLASLAEADGVHVGQEELSVADARSIVGPRCLVGVSTHNIEQARQAVIDGADYIGCGPTFPSTTKAFAAFPGTTFLQQVAAEIALPAFAIGGISLQNLSQVTAAGFRRVAVSGAVSQAADIASAVQQFRAALSH